MGQVALDKYHRFVGNIHHMLVDWVEIQVLSSCWLVRRVREYDSQDYCLAARLSVVAVVVLEKWEDAAHQEREVEVSAARKRM